MALELPEGLRIPAEIDLPTFNAGPYVVNDLDVLTAAWWYLARGRRPIPWVVGEGGRKKVALHGFTYADYLSAPLQRIIGVLQRWESEPSWQVGLALGEGNGELLIDVDDLDQLADWEGRYEALRRDTWVARSGRPTGGLHLLYQRGELLSVWPLQGKFSRDHPRMDAKCNGFAAVAPSIHPTGSRYAWESSSAVELAPVSWNLAMYLSARSAAARGDYGTGEAGGEVGEFSADWEISGDPLDINELREHGLPDGSHDDTLARLVYKLVARGLTDHQIHGVWLAVLDRTVQRGTPFDEGDFQRHLRGARSKLGTAQDRELPAWRGSVPPSSDVVTPATPAVVNDNGVVTPVAGGPADPRLGDDQDDPPFLQFDFDYDYLHGYTCDYDGMAELSLKYFGRWTEWDVELGRFMIFDSHSGYWRMDGRGSEELRRRTRELARYIDEITSQENLLSGDADLANSTTATSGERNTAKARLGARKAFYKVFANRGLLGVVQALEPKVRQCKQTDFNVDPYLLSMSNGTYDVRTGELRSFRQADMITHQVEHVLDMGLASKPLSEVAPNFYTLVRRMCGAPGEVPEEIIDQRMAAVMRWLGYQLHGSNPEKKLGVFEGATDIGKNQVLEIVGEILGSDLAWLGGRPALITKVRGDRHDSEESRLAGKRSVVINELEMGKVLDEVQVLRLVNPDGSTVGLRRMRQDIVDARVTWKISVPTNELPKARLTPQVLNRLLIFVLSSRPVPKEEQFAIKEVVLREEAAAVLAHLVVQWREWYAAHTAERSATGLIITGEMTGGLRAYQDENQDLYEQFGEECLELDADAFSKLLTPLWTAYQGWHKSQHPDQDIRFVAGRNKFYQYLENLPGVRVIRVTYGDGKTRVEGIHGVRLVPKGPTDFSSSSFINDLWDR